LKEELIRSKGVKEWRGKEMKSEKLKMKSKRCEPGHLKNGGVRN
jgi:hypothetical protein